MNMEFSECLLCGCSSPLFCMAEIYVSVLCLFLAGFHIDNFRRIINLVRKNGPEC